MPAMLEVRGLSCGHADTVILQDVTFSVASGELLAVLGRNGVGKTTLLETLMGFTRVHQGHLAMDGGDIGNLPTHQRNRAGLGYVPQEREVFPSLSVAENLMVARRPGGWSADQVYDFFPALGERRGSLGSTLSGGEQQMLAIGRALMGGPRLLLLDEPMEGLAPIIVETLYRKLVELRGKSRMTMVLVEQNAQLALSIADHAIVLDRGRVVHRDTGPALRSNPALLDRLLGVARKET